LKKFTTYDGRQVMGIERSAQKVNLRPMEFGHRPITSKFQGISALLTLSLDILNIYICTVIYIFSSPDPKGHVSYSHHLASVVRRKLFQKSSPLKVLDQLVFEI
jgi:hypothetical protein